MIKISCIGLLIVVVNLPSVFAQQPDMSWTSKVGAAKLSLPDKIFNVSDYGIGSDTNVSSTIAIQKAIDDCAAKGVALLCLNQAFMYRDRYL